MTPQHSWVVVADHAARGSWEGILAADARAATPVPAPLLVEWDLSPRAVVHATCRPAATLAALLPSALQLPHWLPRVGYGHGQRTVFLILEPRERAVVARDEEALRDELGEFLARLDLEEPSDLSFITPQRKTVLVVDDDAMVRTVCRRILQEHYFTLEAGNGPAALALAEWLPLPVDLLVTDLTLPVLNGIQLAERWIDRFPASQALILSGSSLSDLLAPHPFAFLHKPFHAEDLVRMTRALLGMARHAPGVTV
jgi:CheY-like chemotaxis protein